MKRNSHKCYKELVSRYFCRTKRIDDISGSRATVVNDSRETDYWKIYAWSSNSSGNAFLLKKFRVKQKKKHIRVIKNKILLKKWVTYILGEHPKFVMVNSKFSIDKNSAAVSIKVTQNDESKCSISD